MGSVGYKLQGRAREGFFFDIRTGLKIYIKPRRSVKKKRNVFNQGIKGKLFD